MKVFLSWSGERSEQMAEFLKLWLKEVIQAVDPWVSSDIEKGIRWSPKISAELEESKIGIICLTRENLDENWILFEAGALSKTKDARVCTFLLDLKSADIKPPLGQFQHTQFEEEDVRKLIGTINEAVREADEAALDEKLLDKSFNRCWQELEKAFKKIKDQTPEAKKPSRPTDEMIQETLDLVRAMDNRQRQEQRERLEYASYSPKLGTYTLDPDLIYRVFPGVTPAEKPVKFYTKSGRGPLKEVLEEADSLRRYQEFKKELQLEAEKEKKKKKRPSTPKKKSKP